MPLVFAESEATAAGITYEDRTGVSYQYPKSYRRMIQPGEQFVYYRGRRKRGGGTGPQVYFGAGIVGPAAPDRDRPDRFTCEILDYGAFPVPVPFKDAGGRYLESGAERRGYFQPGVRVISNDDFKRIVEAARVGGAAAEEPATVARVEQRTAGPGYASPETLRAVEDFAIRVAVDEIGRRYPRMIVEPQPRNNPGFDILVRGAESSTDERIHIEVKGTTRRVPQFFMTEGELQFSRRHADRFRLIVVYGIRPETDSYECFWHEGAVSLESGFRLTPVQWACEVVRKEPSGRS